MAKTQKTEDVQTMAEEPIQEKEAMDGTNEIQNPEMAKQENPAQKEDGICVYLGPTIHGAIIKGAVFDVNKKTALEQNKGIIEKYPLIAQLIVPGEILPEARIKVKTPGNLLNTNYNKLVGAIKQGGKTNG